MQDSFIFYKSYADAIIQLPEKEQLTALWAIINHSIHEKEQTVAGLANIVYAMAKPQIEANNKRRYDGSKGGRPKKETTGYENEKPLVTESTNDTIENEKPNSNLNLNLNLNDNNNLNENENDNENIDAADAPKSISKKFVPPSVDDVAEYCREQNYICVNAESFVLYYESIGWNVGKNKMKNWHSAVSGWESREKEKRGIVNKPKDETKPKFEEF